MWMTSDQGSRYDQMKSPFAADSLGASTRKLRPLIPKISSAAASSCSNSNYCASYISQQQHVSACLKGRFNHATTSADSFPLNNHSYHTVDQSHKKLHNSNTAAIIGGIGGSDGSIIASSRWNPTQEQLRTLEELYRRGTRTPSADQIQHITAQLRRYGKIEGKNVFYWFQNHKARERQKRRRELDHNLNVSPVPQANSEDEVLLSNNHDTHHEDGGGKDEIRESATVVGGRGGGRKGAMRTGFQEVENYESMNWACSPNSNYSADDQESIRDMSKILLVKPTEACREKASAVVSENGRRSRISSKNYNQVHLDHVHIGYCHGPHGWIQQDNREYHHQLQDQEHQDRPVEMEEREQTAEEFQLQIQEQTVTIAPARRNLYAGSEERNARWHHDHGHVKNHLSSSTSPNSAIAPPFHPTTASAATTTVTSGLACCPATSCRENAITTINTSTPSTLDHPFYYINTNNYITTSTSPSTSTPTTTDCITLSTLTHAMHRHNLFLNTSSCSTSPAGITNTDAIGIDCSIDTNSSCHDEASSLTLQLFPLTSPRNDCGGSCNYDGMSSNEACIVDLDDDHEVERETPAVFFEFLPPKNCS